MANFTMLPGTLIAGKYRVERVLGEGGMGVVVAALHEQLDERVALKFLLPEMLDQKQVVERFAREARAAVKIKSEHVVRVSDVGTLESGAPYMVMEFLEGRDLSQVLAERQRLPVGEALEWILQALEAIAEAHSLGIVHRDLKPPNLFLIKRRDGSACLKVLDFGISKSTRAGQSSALTQTTTAMGSPLYMSPEQWMSARDVDARADIWAVGVILFELLAGHPPFTGDGVAQLCASVMNTPAPSLAAIRPDVPRELADVVARCLGKTPADRFSHVAALAAALAPFAPPAAQRSVDRVCSIVGDGTVRSSSPSYPSLPTAAQTDMRTGATPPAGVGTLVDASYTAPMVRTKSSHVLLGALGLAVVVGAVGFTALARKPAEGKGAGLAQPQPIASLAEPSPTARVLPPLENATGTPSPTATEDSTQGKPPPAKSSAHARGGAAISTASARAASPPPKATASVAMPASTPTASATAAPSAAPRKNDFGGRF